MEQTRLSTPEDLHGRVAITALAVLLPAASGCKTSSWSAPAWPSFGGTKPGDATKLSSAPAFSGDVAKPSATAKPYPTTSTPQGYVLKGPAGGTSGQQAGAGATADIPPVVYGSTPPPATPAKIRRFSRRCTRSAWNSARRLDW